MKLRIRSPVFRITAISLCLILSAPVLSDAFPLSYVCHQPASISQMQRLVNPEDPAVIATLRALVGNGSYDADDLPRVVRDLGVIKGWVDNLHYALDADAHGVADYWQTPQETIALGSGDCEDYAILFTSLLRAYGVPGDQVYVALGEYRGKCHAWVLERCCLGLWRIWEQGLSATLADGAADFKTTCSFNDQQGFNGAPAATAFDLILCGQSLYPWQRGASVIYRRNCQAGERLEVSIQWLVATMRDESLADIITPWSLNIYDEDGALVASWSGTDWQHAIDFTASAAGTYYLEVLKRDRDERYFRIIMEPTGWTPADDFKPNDTDWKHDPSQLDVYEPEGLLRQVSQPPPSELVAYTLELINRLREDWGVPPLLLSDNSAAQAHAEDMLAKRYFALWDSNGLTPAVNYFLAGGSGFSGESIYFTGLSWNETRGDSYQDYLKDLLNGAIINLRSNAYDWNQLRNSGNEAVSIGLAFDDSYLFMVLDYEYSPGVTPQGAPQFQDGVVTLCWDIAGGLSSSPFFYLSSGSAYDATLPQYIGQQVMMDTLWVYYAPLPQDCTAACLNSTQRDGASHLGGQPVAIIGGPNSGYWRQSSLGEVSWPFFSLPRYQNSDAGQSLDERGNILELQGGDVIMTCYTTGAATWQMADSRLTVSADLSAVIAIFGPGVYTIALPYLETGDGVVMVMVPPPKSGVFYPEAICSFFVR